jgi:hypothetical protein
LSTSCRLPPMFSSSASTYTSQQVLPDTIDSWERSMPPPRPASQIVF